MNTKPIDISAQEMEWLHYAIDHMLDDSEPEDQACAKALQALVARLTLPAAVPVDVLRDGGR
ncbi:hypothetical protein VDR48_19925 [Xanthomonas campestris pv. campestris]|nr:hypothetical protein [Xanthomonas campestris pv. campestris]MEB1789645.1 hypothetical protein [Xanthomonas campestris pv. campestris]MEB1844527.1 hypothetical protein [Xanthomonas campestris pv. campestris]MEB1878287.1 hypothetical protein [Xanthomonas campestris pv. campestris]